MSPALTPARGTGRRGLWIGLAVLFVLLVSIWRVLPMLGSGSRNPGDGRNVDSYGFDLADALVPAERIVAAGFPRDGLPALVDPPWMTVDEVLAFNERHRGKYLVSDDRIVGVLLGGEARAYPLRVLNWHEIVNDRLGGVPLAVTYNPLCDSVVVVDRRTGGEPLELRVSGLLYDSNLLMYDRGGESLWSQLQARAIAGPAAREGAVLRVLPASLTHWDRWLAAHPSTTVLRPEESKLRRYQRDPYGNYLRTGKLRFPVAPPPPAPPPAPFDPIVAIGSGDDRRVLPLTPRAEGPRHPLPGIVVDRAETPSVVVDETFGLPTVYSLWFAWYAQHPETAAAELVPDAPSRKSRGPGQIPASVADAMSQVTSGIGSPAESRATTR